MRPRRDGCNRQTTPNSEASTAECGGKDKALRSLLVGHGELTGATGPSSCPARTKVALPAEQERGLSSQESGCMLSTMEKTACSKAEFWIQLFGKHLPS